MIQTSHTQPKQKSINYRMWSVKLNCSRAGFTTHHNRTQLKGLLKNVSFCFFTL